MRSVAIVLAVAASVLAFSAFAWKAEATMPVQSGTLSTMVKKFSQVERTACRGWGKHCPPGFVWTCRPARCWCAPC
jgi:hypothetical protein